MVTYSRCGSSHVFGNDAANPRILFRPIKDAWGAASLVLDEATVRDGIFWVLPEPRAFGGLAPIVMWLDHKAVAQAADGLAEVSERIVFGTAANDLLFVLKGGRGGNFPVDGNRVLLKDPATGLMEYVLDLDKSILSADDRRLVLKPQNAGHTFGRRRQDKGRTTIAIRSAQLVLADTGGVSSIGCFLGEGILSTNSDISVGDIDR
jgi:hypothetical protein